MRTDASCECPADFSYDNELDVIVLYFDRGYPDGDIKHRCNHSVNINYAQTLSMACHSK